MFNSIRRWITMKFLPCKTESIFSHRVVRMYGSDIQRCTECGARFEFKGGKYVRTDLRHRT